MVVLDAKGQFVIDSITPGVYHIAVKNSHTLKRINLSNTLIAGNNNVYFDLLAEGDINNDNQVTVADSLLLMNNYYKVESDASFDRQSDLNGDGITDSLDLALLSGNYHSAGDFITEGCPLSTATLSNTAGCNDQPVELVLSAAQGTGPFDLVINGVTYNNIPVGGTITTVDDETIWPITPSTDSDLDNPVELGVKFSSSEAGFVKGIRFFSANQVAGTYLGHLWSLDGNLLASAEFTNVTANGWQQVLFSEPVAITPGTIYIASYHTSAGYASTEGGLVGGVFNGGSLTVPDENIEGGNSVYTYEGPGFPNHTYNASNYWVDVVFTKGPATFELTSVTSSTGCKNTRQLQTLTVASAGCAQVQQRGAATTPGIIATTEPAVSKIIQEPMLMDALSQNYPNPFAQETIINYSLAKAAKVNLSVFDLNGRLVKILVNASKDAGQHNARVSRGSLASGIYYYKLQTGNYSAVKKMIIQ